MHFICCIFFLSSISANSGAVLSNFFERFGEVESLKSFDYCFLHYNLQRLLSSHTNLQPTANNVCVIWRKTLNVKDLRLVNVCVGRPIAWYVLLDLDRKYEIRTKKYVIFQFDKNWILLPWNVMQTFKKSYQRTDNPPFVRARDINQRRTIRERKKLLRCMRLSNTRFTFISFFI